MRVAVICALLGMCSARPQLPSSPTGLYQTPGLQSNPGIDNGPPAPPSELYQAPAQQSNPGVGIRGSGPPAPPGPSHSGGVSHDGGLSHDGGVSHSGGVSFSGGVSSDAGLLAPAPPVEEVFPPASPFEFSYNIMDGINDVYSEREEQQAEGGPLTGSYSYLRPDGVYQTVVYIADGDGYRAEVIESLTPPEGLMAVDAGYAKYSVSLPSADPYLVELTAEELEAYQAQAAFEAAKQEEEISNNGQISSTGQISNNAQISNNGQISSTGQISSNGDVLSSGSNPQGVRGVQPPSSQQFYNYPAPAQAFNF